VSSRVHSSNSRPGVKMAAMGILGAEASTPQGPREVPLGELVAHLRMATGLGRKAMSAKAGISPTYLKKIELGLASNPSAEILTRLEESLGVEHGRLTGRADGSLARDPLDSYQHEVASWWRDPVIRGASELLAKECASRGLPAVLMPTIVTGSGQYASPALLLGIGQGVGERLTKLLALFVISQSDRLAKHVDHGASLRGLGLASERLTAQEITQNPAGTLSRVLERYLEPPSGATQTHT
jgi:transcriptional regulator with XRE-family HTH domain